MSEVHLIILLGFYEALAQALHLPPLSRLYATTWVGRVAFALTLGVFARHIYLEAHERRRA